jgi:hypothetical protein
MVMHSPTNREPGLHNSGNNTAQTSAWSGYQMLSKSTGRVPVSEAVCIVLRVATDHGDERVKRETKSEQNFEYSDVELSSAKPANGDDIEDTKQQSVISSVSSGWEWDN